MVAQIWIGQKLLPAILTAQNVWLLVGYVFSRLYGALQNVSCIRNITLDFLCLTHHSRIQPVQHFKNYNSKWNPQMLPDDQYASYLTILSQYHVMFSKHFLLLAFKSSVFSGSKCTDGALKTVLIHPCIVLQVLCKEMQENFLNGNKYDTNSILALHLSWKRRSPCYPVDYYIYVSLNILKTEISEAAVLRV